MKKYFESEEEMVEFLMKGFASVTQAAESLADSLSKLAKTQQEMVELMRANVEEQVKAEAEAQAEVLAAKIDEDRTKRSFIGKR